MDLFNQSYRKITGFKGIKLIKIASEDIVKIVVDLAQEQLKPPEERKKVDTGSFKLIYSSSKFPKFDKPYVNKSYCE